MDARLRQRPRTRAELAALIDHTLLGPEATVDDVRQLCAEAREFGVCAVCVSPTMISLAASELAGSEVRVAAVVGFPSGAHRTEVKALEAERALSDGASELDMVINLALARAGAWPQVVADIAAVRDAAPAATLKVILEAGILDPRQLLDSCRASEDAGAQLVKTSTGFHPTGGATVQDVRAMADAVEGRLGVKASGGIRSAQFALELIAAGATRLGLSGTESVLAEMPVE
jgi:deoxyribose-phosphate aldolase